MKFFRPQRVGNLIREELGKMFERDLEFPEALVTITDVDVNTKLEAAIVNFSVLPSEKSERVLEILNKLKRDLQFKMNRKLNIRPMPELVFKIDYGLRNAALIEKALLGDKK
ncbi:MAG: ribosome-binding factor A [Patescibacteria group bacterium]